MTGQRKSTSELPQRIFPSALDSANDIIEASRRELSGTDAERTRLMSIVETIFERSPAVRSI